MPIERLTDEIVRNATPGSSTYVIWDTLVKGFGVRVYSGGTKSYILSYRNGPRGSNPPKQLVTLARYAELDLPKARKQAAQYLLSIRAGNPDPAGHRTISRAAPTVSEGLDQFLEKFTRQCILRACLSTSTFNQYENMANTYILPALGSMRISSVVHRDIEKMVADLDAAERNQVLTFSSRIFGQFEEWGWRLAGTNPCFFG